MFLSNMIFRYTAVVICMMFLVIATVLADRTDESAVVEQTIKHEKNKKTAVTSTSDPQSAKTTENDKNLTAKLKKLFRFTLVGTVLSDTGKSVAIIEDNRTKEQKFYRLDDRIWGGHIVSIQKDRIVLAKDGVDFEVKLDSGTSRGTGAVNIDKGFIEPASPVSTEPVKVEKYDSGFPKIERKVLNDLIKTPKLELPVKSLDNGKFNVGFVLPGGVLAQLGLRARDIIVTVNAKQADAGTSFPEAIANALNDNDNDNFLRLELDRDDDMDVLYFEIVNSSGKLE